MVAFAAVKHGVGQLGKIYVDKAKVTKIVEARERLALISADQREAQAILQGLVSHAFAEVGAPIEQSTLCIDCGLVRPMSAKQVACPDCSTAASTVHEVSNAQQAS